MLKLIIRVKALRRCVGVGQAPQSTLTIGNVLNAVVPSIVITLSRHRE